MPVQIANCSIVDFLRARTVMAAPGSSLDTGTDRGPRASARRRLGPRRDRPRRGLFKSVVYRGSRRRTDDEHPDRSTPAHGRRRHQFRGASRRLGGRTRARGSGTGGRRSRSASDWARSSSPSSSACGTCSETSMKTQPDERPARNRTQRSTGAFGPNRAIRREHGADLGIASSIVYRPAEGTPGER